MEVLRAEGAASVSEFALALRVSESTIRRDLILLDRNGELTRTYGGAVLRPGETIVGHGEAASLEGEFRTDTNIHLKRALAIRAASLIEDGSVIVLDIGTTTPLIARELRGRSVTVITSNLAVLDELRNDEFVRLVMLGGVLRRNYQSFVGTLTQLALTQVTADTVFLSCTGVRPSGNVVDNMALEAPIKQSLIDVADRVILLASETKFPGTGALRLCSLSNIDVVITTAGANFETLALCEEAGGEVMVA